MATIKKALALSEEVTTRLDLVLNGKPTENGAYVPRADAQTTPSVSLANAKGPYLLVSVDLDAPYKSLPFLGPILHLMQPHVRTTKESNPNAQTGASLLLDTSGAPPVTEWIAVNPPPLSGPHRYVLMLFDQPEIFDGKKYGQTDEGKPFPLTKRMRFDMDAFVKDAGLGEMLAAGWFTSN